jgi:hypothetical protein
VRLSAGEQLRSLVHGAQSIESLAELLTRKRPHPIGIGIREKHEYHTDNRNLRLPSFGEGLERLRSEVSRTVPGLDAEQSKAAWLGVLGKPHLLIEVPLPDEEVLITEEITPGSDALARLRRLVLVTVLHNENETLHNGVVNGTRIAGIANLTLQVAPNGRAIEDGWLSVSWEETTRALVKRLEPVFHVSGLSRQHVGISVTLIVQEQVANSVPFETLAAKLEVTASVIGIDLQVVKHSSDSHKRLSDTIAESRPSHLIFLGMDHRLEAIRNAYTVAAGGPRYSELDGSDTDEILETLRERLATIAGVAATLHPRFLVEDEDDRPATSTRPVMPITPVECLHSESHIYVHDSDTALWWTRDTAGHAKVVFKTYTKSATFLTFEADRDESGQEYVGKHKGPNGRTVAVADCHSCGHPETHI